MDPNLQIEVNDLINTSDFVHYADRPAIQYFALKVICVGEPICSINAPSIGKGNLYQKVKSKPLSTIAKFHLYSLLAID